MQTITKNTLVSISLKMEDTNNNLLDESEELMYLHGSYGQIFPKLEEALEGKQVGDTFELLLSPEDAFGTYDETLVVKEALTDLFDDIELGMELDAEGDDKVWIVEEIENGYATLNANHELAGISLRVQGKVLELELLSDEGAQEILNMEHEH